jgi:hypothetical protein
VLVGVVRDPGTHGIYDALEIVLSLVSASTFLITALEPAKSILRLLDLLLGQGCGAIGNFIDSIKGIGNGALLLDFRWLLDLALAWLSGVGIGSLIALRLLGFVLRGINIVGFLNFGISFVQKKDASARKFEGEGHAGSSYVFFFEKLTVSDLVNTIHCVSGKVLSVRVFP